MLIPSVHIPVIAIEGKTEHLRHGTWREGWMTSVADRSAIIELLRMVNAQDVVEIGVHEGYTAACVLENVESVLCYRGIDVLPGYIPIWPHQRQQRELSAYPAQAVQDERFTLILRERGSFDLNPDDVGKCDAMIIDGDHSRQGVLNDTELACHCVRSGGMVIWHDCCPEWINEVQPVLEEMIVAGLAISHVTDTRVAFMRAQ